MSSALAHCELVVTSPPRSKVTTCRVVPRQGITCFVLSCPLLTLPSRLMFIGTHVEFSVVFPFEEKFCIFWACASLKTRRCRRLPSQRRIRLVQARGGITLWATSWPSRDSSRAPQIASSDASRRLTGASSLKNPTNLPVDVSRLTVVSGSRALAQVLAE